MVVCEAAMAAGTSWSAIVQVESDVGISTFREEVHGLEAFGGSTDRATAIHRLGVDEMSPKLISLLHFLAV